MAGSSIRSAAIVGAGLVGSAWAIVFARAGVSVRAFDASDDIRRTAAARIRASLEDMAKAGLVDGVDAICSRVRVVDDLRAAVADVDYVQESVFERVEEKRAVSDAIGALIRDDAVVGGSSSGIPASAFTEHAPRRERFLVAHPVNPPHLVPLVELVPAPWTDPAILPWLRAAMEALGQAPIVVKREIEGFILNRLQGALLREAWALFEEGYASAADIDLTVSHGLGLALVIHGAIRDDRLECSGRRGRLRPPAWAALPFDRTIKSQSAPVVAGTDRAGEIGAPRGAGEGETSGTVGVARQTADGPGCASPLATLGISGELHVLSASGGPRGCHDRPDGRAARWLPREGKRGFPSARGPRQA